MVPPISLHHSEWCWLESLWKAFFYHGKWDRNKALSTYVVPSSTVYGDAASSYTTFLFLAIKELELGVLTVSYLLTQN